MANIEHREITPIQRHAPHSWVVADEAARLALTVAAADVGKYCLQQDDDSQWMLSDDSPMTWKAIGGGGTISAADITDSTTVGRAVLTAADAAAARTAIGAGTSDFSGDYADLSGTPTLGTAAALNVPASGDAAAGEVVLGDDSRLGTGGMANPMTAEGDLIRGGISGAPTRVGIGSSGQVLTVASGVPAWATPTSGGMTNPMTAAGDLIVGGTSGAPNRLAVSTNGYVLTLTAGAPGWAAPSGGGGGTAGLMMIPIMAGSMQPSATGGSGVLTNIATAANMPDVQTLNFNQNTQQYCQFAIPMPKRWNKGSMTARFRWSHAATTTNFGTVWGIQAVAVGDGEAINQAYGTASEMTDTGGITNALYVSNETTAFTAASSPVNGDTIFFRVYRKAADAADTLAIVARLHSIDLFVTTDAENDA